MTQFVALPPNKSKSTKLKPSLIPLSKKSKDTTTEKLKPAIVVVEEFIHESLFERRIITETGLIELAQRLVDWVNKKDSLLLSEFYCDEGITSTHLDRWIERCEDLRRAKSYALRRLAIRREKEATKVNGQYRESMIVRSLHRYSPEWDEDNKYHIRLKAMQQSIQNQIEGKGTDDRYIYIKDIPEDEIEKKDETGT